MPRFVLLRHDCPIDYRDGPHWDLMLEQADTQQERRLATWALLALPAEWMTALARHGATESPPIIAKKLPDHRAVYLRKEGAIGGGRGAVERWASGSVTWIATGETRVVARLVFDSAVLVSGEPLEGEVQLTAGPSDAWELSWTPAGG